MDHKGTEQKREMLIQTLTQWSGERLDSIGSGNGGGEGGKWLDWKPEAKDKVVMDNRQFLTLES